MLTKRTVLNMFTAGNEKSEDMHSMQELLSGSGQDRTLNPNTRLLSMSGMGNKSSSQYDNLSPSQEWSV
jgi:hypothetical protein